MCSACGLAHLIANFKMLKVKKWHPKLDTRILFVFLDSVMFVLPPLGF